MALIKGFESTIHKRPQTHKTHVTCYWSVIHLDGHIRLIQLDTRGSADREKPNKLSQTIQLDREAAKQLHAILASEFGFE